MGNLKFPRLVEERTHTPLKSELRSEQDDRLIQLLLGGEDNIDLKKTNRQRQVSAVRS